MCLQQYSEYAKLVFDHIVPARIKWSQGSSDRYRKQVDPSTAFRASCDVNQTLGKHYTDMCMTRAACANCNNAVEDARRKHQQSLKASV